MGRKELGRLIIEDERCAARPAVLRACVADRSSQYA